MDYIDNRLTQKYGFTAVLVAKKTPYLPPNLHIYAYANCLIIPAVA